jgi:hypothetical protein
MFVGILQTRIDDHRRGAGVETLLQILFRDARHRHGAYCDCAARGLSTCGSNGYCAAARSNGTTRARVGATIVAPDACVCGADPFGSIAQPDDRLPQ